MSVWLWAVTVMVVGVTSIRGGRRLNLPKRRLGIGFTTRCNEGKLAELRLIE